MPMKNQKVSLDVGKTLWKVYSKSSAKRSVLAKAGEVFMSEFLGYFEKTYELSGSIETLNEGISEEIEKVQEAYDSISLTTDLGPIYHSMNDLAVNTKEILNESKNILYKFLFSGFESRRLAEIARQHKTVDEQILLDC